MKKFGEVAAVFGEKIIKYRILVLIVICILTVFSFYGMKKIVMDDSFEGLFDESDTSIQSYNEFKDIFGNENFIFIMVESENIFSQKTLENIRNIGNDVEENLPFVKKVTSLTDIEYIDVIDGDLYVEDLIGSNIPDDIKRQNIIRNKVLTKEIYKNRIITPSGNKTGIFIEFEKIPKTVFIPRELGTGIETPNVMNHQIFLQEDLESKNNFIEVLDPEKLIIPSIETIMERNQVPGISISKVGAPNTNYYLEKTIKSDTAKAFIFALIISILLLSFLYKSPNAVFGTVAVIVISTIMTFGTIGWLGIPLSTFAIIIALLMLILSVSYSIHIINHFKRYIDLHGNRIDAIKYAIYHATWPCFITAATTAIGFISFAIIPMVQIRFMGIGCFIGVFITYSLVMILLPISLSFGKNKEIKESKDSVKKNNSMFMQNWADFSIKNVKPTAIISVVILIIGIVFIFNIDVDTDFIRLYGDRNQFIKEAKHITKDLGALYSYEVFIELPEEGMVKEPEVLQALEEMDKKIQTYKTTKLTTSVNNILKDISMTMNNNKKEFYTIPNSRELIAQYLLLYEMSGGEELSNWIDYNEKYLRLSVQVKKSTTDLRYTFNDIETFGKKNLPVGTKIKIVGDMPLFLKSVSTMVNGQIQSILLAIIGISIMMMVVLKSPSLGLISMIPNVLPVGITLGVMGMLDITLNLQTIVVAPLLIGIAVDDTVHYFLHFKEEFLIHRNYKKANRETFGKIGWAISFTSIILMIGFSAFLTSTVDSVNQIAILMVIGIFTALAADLFITPGLFVLLKPFGPEEKPIKENKNLTNKELVLQL